MKLLAVNGSPRKQWNTAQLLTQVVEGAREAGAEAELVHLVDLKYTGCKSCFACKKIGGPSYGRCVLKVLVLGTPFYICAETAYMRAFEERLWFQYLLYSTVKPPLSPRKKATALVYTMNVREEDMPAYGKDKIVAKAKELMERQFAPCEVFLSCDTLQFDDYSQYDTDMWDEAAKRRRHETVFQDELRRAREMGRRLVS